MKCIKIMEPKSIDGISKFIVVRVSDKEALKLVNDRTHLGLRVYVPKKVYSKFRKDMAQKAKISSIRKLGKKLKKLKTSLITERSGKQRMIEIPPDLSAKNRYKLNKKRRKEKNKKEQNNILKLAA